jgi:tetratricopeptide (TPR) repeat protein
MIKKKSLGIILIILLFSLACSSLSLKTPGVTPIAPESSVTMSPATSEPLQVTPTVVIRVGGNDIFCSSANEDARNAYNDAMNLAKAGKFEEAEGLYLKAIELDPKYCDAMDNLGQLLRQQNRVDEAIEWYKKSLVIMPDNTVALQNIALAYSFQGKTQEAIENYETLIDVAPENPEGYFGLGNIYFNLEQPEKAIPYFEAAEKLYAQSASPYLPDAQYYLGFSYFMVEDCTTAKKYLEPIYTLFSNDGGTNYVLGVCYLTTEPKNEKLARDYILKAQQLGINIPSDILSAIDGN